NSIRQIPRAGNVGIASGKERGTGGRSDGGGVEAIVALTSLGELFEMGCSYRPTEGARHGEADVIAHHDEDVGRAMGWPDGFKQGRVGGGIRDGLPNGALEGRRRQGQNLPPGLSVSGGYQSTEAQGRAENLFPRHPSLSCRIMSKSW